MNYFGIICIGAGMENYPIIIGLCGRSGSGKGYVCEKFKLSGVPSIDTDAVYRNIISDKNSPCTKELKSHFGSVILSENGTVDKRKLASIVFSDENELKELNKITHKFILIETNKLIDEYKSKGCKIIIIDAPVLFESGFDKLCHKTVCVTSGEAKSIERICLRDGIDEEKAKLRLKSQISEEKLRSLCDFEIVNDDVAEIVPQIKSLLDKLSAI